MNHDKLITIGLGYPGTSVKTPFEPDLQVLYVKEKMFALFGHTGENESVNLKTSPDEAWLQRETYPGAVLPGYHMNKRHWNTVVLNGEVPEAVVESMMKESYLLVVAGMTKKAQAELAGSLKRAFPELG
ncbi:MmcQ/YjbR family DNA-binding protein [Paenibacillus herberti]|uniref:MmcQ-like protein n=1 Tax=Paenibacillus herberti TaxID=1619309 RepID=A0A229NU62_9BACL|nr:MmcQ/YjbR family DNA-binding protein [Paenibacillus herberti]OXM13388.1 hypothetical protein CGZ75_20210 [Paenibacillus herberti]